MKIPWFMLGMITYVILLIFCLCMLNKEATEKEETRCVYRVKEVVSEDTLFKLVEDCKRLCPKKKCNVDVYVATGK